MKKLLFLLLFLPCLTWAQVAPNPPQPVLSVHALIDSLGSWVSIHDDTATAELSCQMEGDAMANMALNDSLWYERKIDSNLIGHHITPSYLVNALTIYYTSTQSDARYLQTFTETDPVFSASPAFGISSTLITHWGTAYNKYSTGLGFSGGVFTVTLNDATTLTVNLDGRYLFITDTASNKPIATKAWANTNFYTMTASDGLYVSLTGSYSNPSWITALAASKVSGLAAVSTSGSYNDLSNKPTIPTNNNQLTNGAGYLTGNQALTVSGDASGSGTTSIPLTLATVNASPGTYGNATTIPTLTVNAKGQVTAIGNVAANTSATLNAQTGTTYTLTTTDNGKVVTLNNASAITLTVPSGLGAGFNCLIEQIGAGQVTISASSTTIHNAHSYTKTYGQYSIVTVLSTATDVFTTSGDMQ